MLPSIPDALRSLTDRWRADAARMELYGAEAQATALRRAADDVLATLNDAGEETVSLTEASRRGGYNADSLSRMIRDGRIENVGRKNAPRLRVKDIPIKPQQHTDATTPALARSRRSALSSSAILRAAVGAKVSGNRARA